jgi:hypothetical protein
LATTVFANNDMTSASNSATSAASANGLNATDRLDELCSSRPDLSVCKKRKRIPMTRLTNYSQDHRKTDPFVY